MIPTSAGLDAAMSHTHTHNSCMISFEEMQCVQFADMQTHKVQ